MKNTKIFKTLFAVVYKYYVAKAEKKGRTKADVDTIIYWLIGYNKQSLKAKIENKTDFETFFAEAPEMNSNVS